MTTHTHILLVGHADDTEPILDCGVYGPFDTVEAAQVFAHEFRVDREIPTADDYRPTPEANEAWTDAGWTFAIQRAKRWDMRRAPATDDQVECEGHPAGPFDPMGETVYCDGSCRRVEDPDNLTRAEVDAIVADCPGF